MAEFITAHPALKQVEIVGLLFNVTMSTTLIDTTRAGKIGMIGLSVPLSVWGRWLYGQRGGEVKVQSSPENEIT
jgi:hypothetical protein